MRRQVRGAVLPTSGSSLRMLLKHNVELADTEDRNTDLGSLSLSLVLKNWKGGFGT